MGVITYPCWKRSKSMLVKRPLQCSVFMWIMLFLWSKWNDTMHHGFSYHCPKIFRVVSSPERSGGQWPGPCITNVIATCRKNFSQWESSFLWKLRYHWLKFLRRVAKTLVIQGPGREVSTTNRRVNVLMLRVFLIDVFQTLWGHFLSQHLIQVQFWRLHLIKYEHNWSFNDFNNFDIPELIFVKYFWKFQHGYSLLLCKTKVVDFLAILRIYFLLIFFPYSLSWLWLGAFSGPILLCDLPSWDSYLHTYICMIDIDQAITDTTDFLVMKSSKFVKFDSLHHIDNMGILDTVECRYNMVQHNMMFHTALHWMNQNINPCQITNYTPYIALMDELWGVFC